jgi:uncharacterized membrane protein
MEENLMNERLTTFACSALFAISAALSMSAWADGKEDPCKSNKVYSKAEQEQMNRLILSLFASLKPAPEGYMRRTYGTELYTDNKQLSYCDDRGLPPPVFEASAEYKTKSEYSYAEDKNFAVSVYINRSQYTKSEVIRKNTLTLAFGAAGEAQRPVTKVKGITVDIKAKRVSSAPIPADLIAVMKSVVDRDMLEAVIAGKVPSAEALQAVIATNSANDWDGIRRKADAEGAKPTQKNSVAASSSTGTGIGTTSDSSTPTTDKQVPETPKTKDLSDTVKSLRGLLGR